MAKKTKKTGSGQKTINAQQRGMVGSGRSNPKNAPVGNTLNTQGGKAI